MHAENLKQGLTKKKKIRSITGNSI
jgi:hypothetical protein